MRLIQITPGAGGMYCGNCFRDNALVAELRRMGHDTLMLPLYLPMTVDEEDQTHGLPVFFGGLNVYLDQKIPGYRHAPAWLRRWLDSPSLLRRVAGRTASTRAREVAEITLSMLRGEQGHQRRQLDELVQWLRSQPHPDVVCLSNALLLGLARQIRQSLGTRVVCMLQGEDAFVESMPEPHRTAVWNLLAERAADVDLFIAPSQYFAGRMAGLLQLDPSRVKAVHNGIHLEGYQTTPTARAGEVGSPAPTIGYFARMCPDKGLDTLVEAFIKLRQRGKAGQPRLRIGGGLGPSDQAFVDALRHQLAAAGLTEAVDWVPNVDRAGKVAFLQSLDVFSVPARSGEAFGLYLLEAMAAGVPVVQPQTAAFPEIIEATGGGVLFKPEDAAALAAALEELLGQPEQLQTLGAAARRAVQERYTARHMAERMLAALEN